MRKDARKGYLLLFSYTINHWESGQFAGKFLDTLKILVMISKLSKPLESKTLQIKYFSGVKHTTTPHTRNDFNILGIVAMTYCSGMAY